LIAILFFVLGLIIGSFLNVVIYRYNTARTLGGRSACMSCQKVLCWYELIPLISFVALGGRCKTCKTKISKQYPLVELVTGLIFAGLFLKFQNLFFDFTLLFSASFLFYAVAFSILIVISVYDLKHKIIPDTLALALSVLSFIGIFLFSNSIFHPHMPGLWEFLSGILIALPFALIWLVSAGRWMGLGDAKLGIGLGWLLGLSRATSGVVVAFWAGAIIGVALLVFSRKHGMKSQIPFAPFLVLGAILAFLFEINLFPIF